MAASQVIFFTTKLFKLSLSLCAPASDEFQLTMMTLWPSISAGLARTFFRMMLILTADGPCSPNRLYLR